MEWKFDSERIKIAREARGLTQYEVAKKLGIFTQSVSAWETGDGLTMASFVKLINALETPPSFFIVECGKYGNATQETDLSAA
jgi:transcriptional regulator with XRE-family HTH domain